MLLAESEDELQQLPSDSDSDSDSSDRSLDEDYQPGGVASRTDKEDFSDGGGSDAERRSRPPQRRASRRLRRSASSPLKRPSSRWDRSPLRKRTPRRDSTPNGGRHRRRRSPRTAARPATPRRNTRNGKRAPGSPGEDEEEERWRDADEEDLEPPQPRFRPERDVGPQLNRTAGYTPLELFQLFFSTAVIDTLVRNTNAHGQRKHRGRKEGWLTVTPADMHSFLCLVLYMGIVPLKTLKEFWRGSQLFCLPFPASVMPCRRFLAISRSLHMSHPEAEAANDRKKGTPGYDRLLKVKPLYDQILEACHTFFHPRQHISIDERMVATKARIGLKQYVRNKPTKWGFKLFVLADSSCGYTVNFFIYGGRESEPTGKGQSYDAVMRLLDIPFLGRGYKLYVDNFYTSPALFLDLLKRKVWACGTVRSTVSGYPRTKARGAPEKTARGTIRWIRQGQLLFVKWFDAREVTMCSTIHKAFSNDVAKRKVKNAEGLWTVKQVPIPGCIKDYNKHMGGVDLSDALIGYYNVLHKTQRWYKTLFYHFVDIATVNAFILHKELCRLQSRPALTQKSFREQLILSLAAIGSAPRRAGPHNFMSPVSPFKVPPPAPAEAPPPAAPDPPAPGHLPSYFVENMSNVASRDRATAGRRACVVCKRKSPVYCSTCQKTLCFTTLRNCYSEWHRSNNICL